MGKIHPNINKTEIYIKDGDIIYSVITIVIEKEDTDWNYWVACLKQTDNTPSERLNLG